MLRVGLEQLCLATIKVPFSHDTTDGDWGRVRRTSSVARTTVCCSSQHTLLWHLLCVPALPLSFARLGTRVMFNGRALEAKEQGNTLYKQGKYANAIDMYTKAIGLSGGALMSRLTCVELQPKEAAYYNNRAAASLMLQRVQSALDDALMACKLDPATAKVLSCCLSSPLTSWHSIPSACASATSSAARRTRHGDIWPWRSSLTRTAMPLLRCVVCVSVTPDPELHRRLL